MAQNLQETLVTAASIISGFGSLVIGFRLERELDAEKKDRSKHTPKQWIPVADWLIIVSVTASLCLVVAPLVASDNPGAGTLRLAAAVCAAAAIMVGGYIPAILAHYRFIYGLKPSRSNPTFWEGLIVSCTAAAALAMFAYSYWGSGIH